MFESIEKLMENDDELFAVGGIAETKAQELEGKLNVTFTSPYLEAKEDWDDEERTKHQFLIEITGAGNLLPQYFISPFCRVVPNFED